MAIRTSIAMPPSDQLTGTLSTAARTAISAQTAPQPIREKSAVTAAKAAIITTHAEKKTEKHCCEITNCSLRNKET